MAQSSSSNHYTPMPKKLIKRFMPDHAVIREHKHLKVFGTLLHDPNLFHLNRRSASGAFAVGLFMAYVPVPFQMLLAAASAILFRVNLPLSVALVWITNPLTMPPMFYFAYLVGTWLIGAPTQEVNFELSMHWLMTELGAIWRPFLLGCFILASLGSLAGYFGVRGLWRLRLISHWRRKKEARRLRELDSKEKKL